MNPSQGMREERAMQRWMEDGGGPGCVQSKFGGCGGCGGGGGGSSLELPGTSDCRPRRMERNKQTVTFCHQPGLGAPTPYHTTYPLALPPHHPSASSIISS